MVRSKELPAHCNIHDEDCVKRHKSREKGIYIDVSSQQKKANFIGHMRQSIEKNYEIEHRLDKFGVKHIKVKYEKLFDSQLDDGEIAHEWIRILDFLGFASHHNLTMGDVRNTFEYASTTEKSHEKIIANYEQVRETLEGTELFYLLH